MMTPAQFAELIRTLRAQHPDPEAFRAALKEHLQAR